jgi:hypothetical protein
MGCANAARNHVSAPLRTLQKVWPLHSPVGSAGSIEPTATFALPYVLHNGFKGISLDYEQESLLLQAFLSEDLAINNFSHVFPR